MPWFWRYCLINSRFKIPWQCRLYTTGWYTNTSECSHAQRQAYDSDVRHTTALWLITSPLARASHLYVPCTTSCDGNQTFWSLKLALDRLILPWSTSWSLDRRNFLCLIIVDLTVATPSGYSLHIMSTLPVELTTTMQTTPLFTLSSIQWRWKSYHDGRHWRFHEDQSSIALLQHLPHAI